MNRPPSCADWIRRLGFVTTTRADYGIYRPLLAALHERRRYELIRFAGGTHLRDEFGRTIDEVRRDAFGEVVEVDYLQPADDPAGVAASAGAAITGIGRALADRPVDVLFLLGDRYEMLSAALAAVLHRIPIAHLHGGDATAGAYDDLTRNAVTKLAAMHFPALPEHAARIESMGEEPWRICVTGALALDELAKAQFEPPTALTTALGIDLSQPTLVVLLHPETRSELSAEQQFDAVAAAVEGFDGGIVLIGSNADEGHRGLRAAQQRFVERRPRTVRISSLPPVRFWSCLRHAAALVGNSSSGMIESASLGLPVVNVGLRQAGRLHAENVIDVPDWDAAAISAAIRTTTSAEFRARARQVRNPWGDGHAAERIVAAVESAPERRALLVKPA